MQVRTLDALHLASLDFLTAGGLRFDLASCDRRMVDAAAAMGASISNLSS